jgi:hypothetical protein
VKTEGRRERHKAEGINVRKPGSYKVGKLLKDTILFLASMPHNFSVNK